MDFKVSLKENLAISKPKIIPKIIKIKAIIFINFDKQIKYIEGNINQNIILPLKITKIIKPIIPFNITKFSSLKLFKAIKFKFPNIK